MYRPFRASFNKQPNPGGFSAADAAALAPGWYFTPFRLNEKAVFAQVPVPPKNLCQHGHLLPLFPGATAGHYAAGGSVRTLTQKGYWRSFRTGVARLHLRGSSPGGLHKRVVDKTGGLDDDVPLRPRLFPARARRYSRPRYHVSPFVGVDLAAGLRRLRARGGGQSDGWIMLLSGMSSNSTHQKYQGRINTHLNSLGEEVPLEMIHPVEQPQESRRRSARRPRPRYSTTVTL